MTQINPYLNFNGRCHEAMRFYQECLGGELQMQKVGESPMAVQLPSEAALNVLHSFLKNDRLQLMGSDMIGNKLVNGNSVMLCLDCSNEMEMHLIFEKLSNGGQIRTPLHQTFWGATYGVLTDQYGINWMLNYKRS